MDVLLGCYGLMKDLFLKIYWVLQPIEIYKPTNAIHADSPGVYTSDKILLLSTKNKILLKTNVIKGSMVNASRQPIIYSFVLDKPAGYKVFSQPETIL